MAQPYLHELVSCIAAPSVALSGTDGQICAGGVQGVLRHDRRLLSELIVTVDGQEPTPVGHTLGSAAGNDAASVVRFDSIIRHLGDPTNDPTVRIERERRVRTNGMQEELRLVNNARTGITTHVRVSAASDLAPMSAVRRGDLAGPRQPDAVVPQVAWTHHASTVRFGPCSGGDHEFELEPDGRVVWSWHVTIPARSSWSMTFDLTVEDSVADPHSFPAAAPSSLGWAERAAMVEVGPAELARLVERSVGDLRGLALADPTAPGDAFLAAGSPWFFTLFGRDTLWAARLTLPLGTGLARGTLRILARRQGTRHDRETGEAPGKILHEVRPLVPDLGGHHGLPPLYFGTIDATALWICLLHDAWRWGLPDNEVAELLDPLEAALAWLRTDADPDGDGFLEYIDETGRGLANQGWKDSGDAIQFPDGTIAKPPIALCEAQAYAYEAALAGATLLESFGRSGADVMREWAASLRKRFRQEFWVFDARGRFPALALDGAKRPVDTPSSNLGHLFGTGLLDADESAAVAARIAEPDLDSGFGLRTMSSDVIGFNGLGYHAGTVWPHDTAIAIRGLTRDGHDHVAASLAAGLLRAAPDFGYRLPELFGGTDGRNGGPVLAYPAACRPQAWSAAAAISLLQAALGLDADVPAGRLRVAPSKAFKAWFPLRVSGLHVAGHPLTIDVDATGKATVETTAPLSVESADVPIRC
ncbi:MAG TPA: glycogen debranching N-terminal domain-containing protein [Actinopolymorphaceae bacterium]